MSHHEVNWRLSTEKWVTSQVVCKEVMDGKRGRKGEKDREIERERERERERKK